jgi:hypothetical protein
MGDEINWDDSGWDSNALAELNQYNQGSEEVQPWQNTDNSGMNEVSDSSLGYSDTTEEVPSWANVSTTGDTTSGNMFNVSDLEKLFRNNPALSGIAKVLGSVGAGKLADKLFDVQGGPGGYKGGIPTLTASRQMLPIPTTMQNASGQTVARRPGSGGVTYFSPTRYLKPGETPEPAQVQPNVPVQQPTSGGISELPQSGSGLPSGFWNDMRSVQQPQQSPAQRVAEGDAFYQSPEFKAYQKSQEGMMSTDDMYDSPYFGPVSSGSAGRAMDKAYEQYKGIAPRQNQMSSMPFDLSSDIGNRFAGGGIANLGGYSDGGRLLRGPGDGVSDSIPAMIGKKQPARLADGEFVIPARIVSELGNGSTEAGARKLYAMMDRIKKARSKAKNIAADTKADKHLPA